MSTATHTPLSLAQSTGTRERQRRTEYSSSQEEHREGPPDLERAGHVRLRPPEPEEADNDGEVDDLLRVALDVEDEGIRNRRRGCDEDDYLRIQ